MAFLLRAMIRRITPQCVDDASMAGVIRFSEIYPEHACLRTTGTIEVCQGTPGLCVVGG